MRRRHLRATTRAEGDFHLDHVDPDVLDARRRAIVDRPWTQLDEVHGCVVRVVTEPGEHDRAVGDALVTTRTDVALAVWVGDCAPVAFFDDVAIGVAHAGWRGLYDGVLAATVVAMRSIGRGRLRAVLGPSIHPCCYEFSEADLEPFAERWGPGVRGRTSDGRSALDVPATIASALAELDVELEPHGRCTGCRADEFWSHRVRGELGRQLVAVWQDEAVA